MRKALTSALLLCAASLLLAAAVAPAPNYYVAHRYVLGGDGGWDYLTYDPGGKRLFISRSSHVMVVDPKSGKVLGDIANTPGVHGVALAPQLERGFTSNGAGGSVGVFDLRTLQTLTTIATGARNPDGIVYDPASGRVFTFNGGSGDATAIDAQTNAVVATIPLGGRPEFPVVDGRGTIYDNIESTNEIVAIDARKAAIVARWPLGNCRSPSGLSMDRLNRRLFVACRGVMAVVNADTGKVIATLSTGAGTDATRFDPQKGLPVAPKLHRGELAGKVNATETRIKPCAERWPSG